MGALPSAMGDSPIWMGAIPIQMGVAPRGMGNPPIQIGTLPSRLELSLSRWARCPSGLGWRRSGSEGASLWKRCSCARLDAFDELKQERRIVRYNC